MVAVARGIQMSIKMSKEEFKEDYKRKYGLLEEEMQAMGLDVVPCDCECETCPGWMIILEGEQDE